MLEILPALATFGGALVFAGDRRSLLALRRFIVIWREGIGGVGTAFTALADRRRCCSPIRPISACAAYRLPTINDITTDPIDPPRFDAMARLRPRDANPVDYAGLYAAELQRDGLSRHRAAGSSTATPQVAYDAALAVITKRKWRVVDATRAAGRPPRRPDRGGGAHADHGLPRRRRLRIRAARDGARIDVRSASRYGRHDFGTNASRIRSLLEDDRRSDRRRAPEPSRSGRSRQKKPPARRRPQRSAGRSDRRRRSTAAPSVATSPRATRSSRCASTDMPAAPVSRGSRPI